jgi:hypothetical protein
MQGDTHYVEIVSFDDGDVIKRMGPMPERKAERVDSGANINLDHANYYTRVVPVVSQPVTTHEGEAFAGIERKTA